MMKTKKRIETLCVLLVFVVMAGCRSAPDPVSYQTNVGARNPDWLASRLDAKRQVTPVVPGKEVTLPSPEELEIRGKGGGQPGDPFRPQLLSAPMAEPAGSHSTASDHGNSSTVNVTIHNTSSSAQALPRSGPPASERSRIEQLYHETPGLSGGQNLRQIGYAFFDRQPDQNSRRPVDPSAKVREGDVILIQATGSLELDEQFTVSEAGEIFLKDVGALSVGGIEVGKLREHLQRRLSQEYEDVQLTTAVGDLQAIRINFTGFVKEPGVRLLPANTSLIEALSAAGGPMKKGSLRKVSLIREGQPVQVVDMYALIRDGEHRDRLLVNGDTVHVSPLGKTVAVVGPVNEGIYELVEEETLKHLVETTGGLNAFTLKERVLMERMIQGQGRVLSQLNVEQHSEHALQDGDVVVFQTAEQDLSNSVHISGPVIRPGFYPYTKGLSLKGLLKLSKGFYLDASLSRLAVVRQTGAPTAFDVTPGDGRGEVRQRVLWFDIRAVMSGGEHLELQPLDRVQVFRQHEVQNSPQVTIQGAVRRPGIYPLTSGMRLADVVALAGGITEEAYLGKNTLVRRRLSADRTRLDVETLDFELDPVLQGEGGAEILMQNQDAVVIRRVQKMAVNARVTGRVRFPGEYVLPHGAQVADLLEAAGGLASSADLRGAVFTRDRVRRLQQQRLEQMIARSEEVFARNRDVLLRTGHGGEGLAGQASLQGLNRLAANMARYQVDGRVVLDLLNPDFESSTHNLVLENGDALDIPAFTVTVTVVGRVFSPNTFVWEEGLSIKEYIEKTGGLLEDADEKEVFAILANGEVKSAAQKKGRRAFMAFVPGPGDTILVPSKPVERSALSTVSDVLRVAQQAAGVGLTGAAIPAVRPPVSPDVNLDLQATEPPSPPSGLPLESFLPGVQP